MTSRRTQAMEYAEARQLPKLLETIIFQVLRDRPEDHIQYMIDRLTEMRLSALGETTVSASSEGAIATEGATADDTHDEEEQVNFDGIERTDNTNKASLTNGEVELSDLLNNSPIIFIVGGPGSGKGTQCKLLAENLSLVHISTGDLLRSVLENEDNKRSKQIREIIEAGQLVPLEWVLDLLKDAMLVKSKMGAKGFLIDGYPRDIEQAERFDQTIGKCWAVIHLKASEDTMIERISARSRTQERIDDDSAVERIKVFHEETLPVLEHYKSLVKEIDAERSIQDVFNDIMSYLKDILIEDQQQIN